MHLLFGSQKKTVPQITGLQVQTSVNALPIPIIYGSPRTSMNLIYANGFFAVPAGKSGKGGKGLLTGGKNKATSYNYFATFQAALCEAPANGVGDVIIVYDNAQVYPLNAAPNGKSYIYYKGLSSQTPDPTVASQWPQDAFAYRYTAYITCPTYPLDATATIPQLNFVVQGIFTGSCPLFEYTTTYGAIYLMDADPALCVYDLLTDSIHGAGFPTDLIDWDSLFTQSDGFDPAVGDQALSTYCQAVGFGYSVVLNNSEPCDAILDRWMKNLVVAIVWTGYTLRFIPYYDSYASLNPGYSAAHATTPLKYFNPNTTPLFDLTDDDFIQATGSEDPVIETRIDVADVKNVVRGDFRDRNNQFNDNIAEYKDENMVALYGDRVDRVGLMDEFTLMDYAATAVQLRCQRNVAIRRTFSFRLGMQYCILDPMDIVTLTDTVLGLNKFPVRIRSIEEDEKGILTIVAEEMPLGAQSATLYARQANEPPQAFFTNNPPGPVNPPLIMEPTVQALQALSRQLVPTIAFAISGGNGATADPDWGGCNIFISNDNVTYLQIGQQFGPSRMGYTASDLPAYSGTNPDTVDTLLVDLNESGGTLAPATAAQAAAGFNLCVVWSGAEDFEIMAFEGAVLVSAGVYRLTNLYRALYGTVACAKGSGTKFTMLDQFVFEEQIPTSFLGNLIYVKFQSFNTYGLMLESLADVTAYTYTPLGIGTNVSADPVVSALLAGTPVDLNTSQTEVLDLNIGGSGSCAPNSVIIDLNT